MKWIDFLGKYYKEEKRRDPEYKYKQAMTDAVGPYRNQASGSMSVSTRKKKRGKNRRTVKRR